MKKRKYPWLVRAIALWLRPLLKLIARHEWDGVEKLPDEGFVFAINHLSWVDPFTLALFQYDNNIPPRYLAKSSLFELPIAGWILHKTGQIPVYRATGRANEAFSAAIDVINSGDPVVFYAEGTITRDPDLWPMSGKTGPVRVALETGKPLIPIAQWGAQNIWYPYSSPKTIRIFPRRTIQIKVGDPVDLSDLAGQEITNDILHEAADRMMDAITALLIDIRGEKPTSPRLDSQAIVAMEAEARAAKEAKEAAKSSKRRGRKKGTK